MSDGKNVIGSRERRPWVLGGMVLAATLAVAAPGWAQSAEDLNYAELGRLNTAAPAQPEQAMTPAAPGTPSYPAQVYPAQGYAYPADIDCNSPYYAAYCMQYAAWLNQYYAAYGDSYPYDDWYYGYPADVAFGFGFFRGHRFHNFHHFAVAHGMGFHGGGFHGGGFHGGGFHGGGGHR